jgi:hypothetical protein
MIDLPDFGYTQATFKPNDPTGYASGELGGPDDRIPRLGYRYAIEFTIPALTTQEDAQSFQSLLEQTANDDASYPWPLDYASPAGSTIPLKGLVPGYSFRAGQPVAVISGGVGFVHKATAEVIADNAGHATLPVFPWTRVAFVDGDTVEVENPRIRGILTWGGATQGVISRRPFTFTISERT